MTVWTDQLEVCFDVIIGVTIFVVKLKWNWLPLPFLQTTVLAPMFTAFQQPFTPRLIIFDVFKMHCRQVLIVDSLRYALVTIRIMPITDLRAALFAEFSSFAIARYTNIVEAC